MSGPTRYDGGPSVPFSAETTQFDDELIKRGIIRHEQAIFRKGASGEESSRLAAAAKGHSEAHNSITYDISSKNDTKTSLSNSATDDEQSESDDDDSFLDDEFMARYRNQRINELQEEQRKQQQRPNLYGEVIPISRPEWKTQVNDSSEDAWVVVCLTSHGDSNRTSSVVEAIHALAMEHPHVKFVTIPSHQAIPNWPEANLPSLFLYRDGKMQHELLRLSISIDVNELRQELLVREVLEETD